MYSQHRLRDVQYVDSSTVADFAARQLDWAATRPTELLAKRTFRLPYLDLTVYFSDEAMADRWAAGLARCLTGRQPSARHALEIHVTCGTDDDAPGPAVWRESNYSPGGFERVIAGRKLRGYYHREFHFWQFYDPATGRGIQSMLADDVFPPWEPASPLRAFLHWAYGDLGMRLAHAATLGHYGRGVLMAGAGGSGKSGTTLSGIAHGLTSVGDDYVLIDNEPIRQAHAVFATMKQDVAGLQRVGLDRLAASAGKVNWQNKLEFYPATLLPGAAADRLEVTAILLPKIARLPRTVVRPVRSAQAMLALAPSGLFQMPGCAVEGARFFADLVRQVPAYELLLSEDPADIADAIRNFLAAGELAHAG